MSVSFFLRMFCCFKATLKQACYERALFVILEISPGVRKKVVFPLSLNIANVSFATDKDVKVWVSPFLGSGLQGSD